MAKGMTFDEMHGGLPKGSAHEMAQDKTRVVPPPPPAVTDEYDPTQHPNDDGGFDSTLDVDLNHRMTEDTEHMPAVAHPAGRVYDDMPQVKGGNFFSDEDERSI